MNGSRSSSPTLARHAPRGAARRPRQPGSGTSPLQTSRSGSAATCCYARCSGCRGCAGTRVSILTLVSGECRVSCAIQTLQGRQFQPSPATTGGCSARRGCDVHCAGRVSIFTLHPPLMMGAACLVHECLSAVLVSILTRRPRRVQHGIRHAALADNTFQSSPAMIVGCSAPVRRRPGDLREVSILTRHDRRV